MCDKETIIMNIENEREMKRKNEMKDLINASLETRERTEQVLKICEENDIHSITELVLGRGKSSNIPPITFKKIKKNFLILRKCNFYKPCNSCFDFMPELKGPICKDCRLYLKEFE